MAVEFLKEMLDVEDVKTLILSRDVAVPCVLALSEDLGKSDRRRWLLPTHTLIIHPGLKPQSSHEYLLPLLSIAQERNAIGFPFKSILLFFPGAPEWEWDWDVTVDMLERCVGKLEVVLGDDALDWDVDKYFLDGLEHLQKNRDVEWDR